MDWTGAGFDTASNSLTGITMTADEGSDWYLVNYGDEFSSVTIDDGLFTMVLGVTDAATLVTNTVAMPQGEFYLGVNTGLRFSGPMPSRDVYGWAHLSNNNGTLTMIDNAMAYGELGLYAGTAKAVPEPEPTSLLVIGLVAALVCCRRRRSYTFGSL